MPNQHAAAVIALMVSDSSRSLFKEEGDTGKGGVTFLMNWKRVEGKASRRKTTRKTAGRDREVDILGLIGEREGRRIGRKRRNKTLLRCMNTECYPMPRIKNQNHHSLDDLNWCQMVTCNYTRATIWLDARTGRLLPTVVNKRGMQRRWKYPLRWEVGPICIGMWCAGQMLNFKFKLSAKQMSISSSVMSLHSYRAANGKWKQAEGAATTAQNFHIWACLVPRGRGVTGVSAGTLKHAIGSARSRQPPLTRDGLSVI